MNFFPFIDWQLSSLHVERIGSSAERCVNMCECEHAFTHLTYTKTDSASLKINNISWIYTCVCVYLYIHTVHTYIM